MAPRLFLLLFVQLLPPLLLLALLFVLLLPRLLPPRLLLLPVLDCRGHLLRNRCSRGALSPRSNVVACRLNGAAIALNPAARPAPVSPARGDASAELIPPHRARC